jgi:hypothetical protein
MDLDGAIDWRSKPSFWGEITPCEHFVQFYDGEGAFLDTLTGFVSGGLRSGEGVIIIATPEHRAALERRMSSEGIDTAGARARDQYIVLDANETLSCFMVKGWPDDERFELTVTNLIARAGKGGRRVRAFGEMVALLWAQGHAGATVRLEHLWQRICEQKGFSLFCAYPRIGFTQGMETSIHELCAAHSKVLAS